MFCKKIYLGILAAILTTTAVSGENLVANPGFEMEMENGRIPHWVIRKNSGTDDVFSLSEEAKNEGKKSLLFNNALKSNYILCTQDLKLEPGKTYRFGGKVKYAGVTGLGDIAIDLYDRNGRYLKGVYPNGPSDAPVEWRTISGIIGNIPSEIGMARLIVYARKGTVGRIWFDEIYCEEFIPKLLGQMTTDCYRDLSDGGPVQTAIRLNFGLAGTLPAELGNIDLEILDASGKVVMKVPQKCFTENSAIFLFDSSKLAPGTYNLSVTVKHPRTGKIEKCSIQFRRLAKMPQRHVSFDRCRRMILEGKPFFPLGMYFPVYPVNEEALDIFAKGPFNCILPYSELSIEQLDQIQKRGIKVIYNLKDYVRNFRGLKTDTEAFEKFRKELLARRNHPAIIAWYINDEHSLGMLPVLAQNRAAAEELDPDRPTYSVLYQVNEVGEYLPSLDVVGTDPYPVPDQPISTVADWTALTEQGTFGFHPTWMVIQAFNWGKHRYYQGCPQSEILACRSPNQTEIRVMAWSAIARGANGLMFYSWMDLTDLDQPKPELPMKREPFDQRWNDLRTVGNEIVKFERVLLSDESPATVKALNSSGKTPFRLYSTDGRTWLLVVNPDASGAKISFSIPAGLSNMKTEFGTGGMTLKDNILTLDLAPFSVRFVSLGKEASPGKL